MVLHVMDCMKSLIVSFILLRFSMFLLIPLSVSFEMEKVIMDL